MSTNSQYSMPYSLSSSVSASIKSSIGNQGNSKKRRHAKMLNSLRNRSAVEQTEAADYSLVPINPKYVHESLDYSTASAYSGNSKGEPNSFASSEIIIKSEPVDEFSGTVSTHGYISTPSSSNFQQNFPTAGDFKFVPEDVPLEMVSTFLLMYKSHTQRILDTFQLANIEELERTVTHFWSEMPTHLRQLLVSPMLLTLVECVDSLLYRVSCPQWITVVEEREHSSQHPSPSLTDHWGHSFPTWAISGNVFRLYLRHWAHSRKHEPVVSMFYSWRAQSNAIHSGLSEWEQQLVAAKPERSDWLKACHRWSAVPSDDSEDATLWAVCLCHSQTIGVFQDS